MTRTKMPPPTTRPTISFHCDDLNFAWTEPTGAPGAVKAGYFLASAFH